MSSYAIALSLSGVHFTLRTQSVVKLSGAVWE